MEEAITAIRGALAPEANAEARAAGIAACRAVLGALEPTTTVAVAPPNAAAVAQIVGALRGVPPDQLLDLAITRLRAALPPGTEVAPVKPIQFHLIQIPKRGG